MLQHKNSNTPYSYGMMLATTAASSLPLLFFYSNIFTVVFPIDRVLLLSCLAC